MFLLSFFPFSHVLPLPKQPFLLSPNPLLGSALPGGHFRFARFFLPTKTPSFKPLLHGKASPSTLGIEGPVFPPLNPPPFSVDLSFSSWFRRCTQSELLLFLITITFPFSPPTVIFSSLQLHDEMFSFRGTFLPHKWPSPSRSFPSPPYTCCSEPPGSPSPQAFVGRDFLLLPFSFFAWLVIFPVQILFLLAAPSRPSFLSYPLSRPNPSGESPPEPPSSAALLLASSVHVLLFPL